jgi:predicted RNA binding protein YcfA (HicA-like mRNA interferase family)/predicted RNase H-like HicB family nuclease
MKVHGLIELIEADGWFQARMKGSHRQFHHSTKRGTVTVSGKPNLDIPPGTLHSALKQAGLKNQEWGLMRYLVVLEKGPTSYGAHVPDLPGCIAVGETRDEVLALVREAIEFHLEGLKQEGQPIPDPSSTGELVDVAAAWRLRDTPSRKPVEATTEALLHYASARGRRTVSTDGARACKEKWPSWLKALAC